MSQASQRPHIVIVGGGFGGLSAARALGRAPARISLVDRQNHHLFQPLLYQVAMAGLSPADIAMPIRSVVRRQQNVEVLLAEVERVELDARRAVLSDGAELRYDYLVVAAGARTNYFGNEDRFQPHSLGLKSIDDALEIRRRVLLAFEAAERETDADARRRLLTFVIIGGGPTGVEIAGALAELSRYVLADDFRLIEPEEARIVVVEMMDRLLPGGFDEKLAKSAEVQLASLGVEVRLSTKVASIDQRGVHLEQDVIEAATVLWTAGVRARGLAKSLGAELDRSGRVVVGDDCSIPGHPEVFVIGDIARFVPEGEKEPLPGLAPVAMQQGRYVARRIAAKLHGGDTEPFRYVDKGIMATVGRSRAIVQAGRLRLSGFIAWIAWIFIHIYYLIGFRNRVVVLFNWFWSYVTYKRGARLITGDRPWDELPKLAAKAELRSGDGARAALRAAPISRSSVVRTP
jgi:NADH dehydrogenase